MGRIAKAAKIPDRELLPSEVYRVDEHVGNRVRLRRKLLGLSQTTLGQALGIAFQQVQKYERGTNRISSSTLYAISRVLDVPVSYFFDGLPMPGATAPVAMQAAANGGRVANDPMRDPEIIRLVAAYYRIEDEDLRKQLLLLIRSVARRDGDEVAV